MAKAKAAQVEEDEEPEEEVVVRKKKPQLKVTPQDEEPEEEVAAEPRKKPLPKVKLQKAAPEEREDEGAGGAVPAKTTVKSKVQQDPAGAPLSPKSVYSQMKDKASQLKDKAAVKLKEKGQAKDEGRKGEKVAQADMEKLVKTLATKFKNDGAQQLFQQGLWDILQDPTNDKHGLEGGMISTIGFLTNEQQLYVVKKTVTQFERMQFKQQFKEGFKVFAPKLLRAFSSVVAEAISPQSEDDDYGDSPRSAREKLRENKQKKAAASRPRALSREEYDEETEGADGQLDSSSNGRASSRQEWGRPASKSLGSPRGGGRDREEDEEGDSGRAFVQEERGNKQASRSLGSPRGRGRDREEDKEGDGQEAGFPARSQSPRGRGREEEDGIISRPASKSVSWPSPSKAKAAGEGDGAASSPASKSVSLAVKEEEAPSPVQPLLQPPVSPNVKLLVASYEGAASPQPLPPPKIAASAAAPPPSLPSVLSGSASSSSGVPHLPVAAGVSEATHTLPLVGSIDDTEAAAAGPH